MLRWSTRVATPLLGAVDFAGYIGWTLAVMGSIIALGFVAMALRRRLGPGVEADAGRSPFSMESLEDMRRRGEIDEAEFKALRRSALGLDATDSPTEKPASSEQGGVSMNDEV